MAEIISGDKTKGIKSVGELALRISKFDSYRLFTLYENTKERKVMNVSGDQKYYLVFKSPKKEIRIPEYDPKGFFEVDKVNGCVLFKITKKNAEDILSMKTGGEKIFYIIRVFEERDAFGKVLNVTDEVEVYHGKWGDDEAFTTFTTENTIDYLNKTLAEQNSSYTELFNNYNNLLEQYKKEVEKTSSLEDEMEQLRSTNESLQTQLNEYLGDTYDGTILSTDTKYIAFEGALENINYTADQIQSAIGEILTTGSVDLTGPNYNNEYDNNDVITTMDIKVNIPPHLPKDMKVSVYRNDVELGVAENGQYKNLLETILVEHNNNFKFVCTGATGNVNVYLKYTKDTKYGFDGAIILKPSTKETVYKDESVVLYGTTNFYRYEGEYADSVYYPNGNIGTLECIVELKK